jgi:predicted AlkP superfamily pyrophosphatase or phosphodiesterase
MKLLRNSRWFKPYVALLFALVFTAPAYSQQAAPAQPAQAQPTKANRQLFLEQAARAYFPGRTGQIVVIPREGTIITKHDPGVVYMHGSPWPYDTHIPFLLYGPRFVKQGTYAEPVAQQDMAPTLGALGGVSMPATTTGRILRSVLKPANERPRLVVLAVLDGMRVDYFDRHASHLPTLTRLRRGGAWFSNARLNYLPSITSLAHASIATGADPRVHGIVGNLLFDRVAGTAVDTYPELSPRNLMALTLADMWNVYTDGRAVIIGQGSTPRAAIPLAGHGKCVLSGRAIIAVSFNEKSGGWETNPECFRLPDYLLTPNIKSTWEAAGGRWLDHTFKSPGEVRASALYSKFEAEALKLMIEHEPLGADDVPDLLMVNLKTPDYVGHRYGPDSPELADTVAALDRDLATVIAALDAKVGRERYVLAITADHGMPPEPDTRRGQQRVYTEDIVKMIHEKFDPEQGKLVRQYEAESGQLTIDQERLRALGVTLDTVRMFLEAQPYIYAAYTEDELRRASATLR